MLRSIRLFFFFTIVAVATSVPQAGFAQAIERTTTVADRDLVNLTIYNGGTALVHDRRRVSLDAGINRIAWRDVSASMDPTTALLEPIGSNDRLSTLEQNFDFDVLNPQALLAKYVGRDVVVVHDPRFAGERETRETARILSVADGIVLQYRDRIETEVRGHIIYPAGSTNVRDQPTLLLDMLSSRGGPQTIDLSYLTTGITWRADYVGVLSPDESHLALRGLVTLSNTSGTGYRDARLQLVAGNVNIVQPPDLRGMVKSGVGADLFSVNAAAPAQQENYFEYHLYTMPRRTTIANNETKQLSLLDADAVPVRKTLELRGSQDYYRSAQPDLGDRLPVGVYVSFDNRGGDLGIPLPAGIVRLYENDSHGLSQFLGSDNVDHTPRNETVRLHLGNSFDVTARKRQTDFRIAAPCFTDSSYEIVLSNAKPSIQKVLVVESIPGEWRISDESASHVKSSASTANWLLPVPADGKSTLTYTAHVKWC